MSKVVKEDIGTLSSVLVVTLEKGDYEPKFNADLNRYRKEAQIKGFRKGKTPLSLVKKMYGKALLSEAINESLQKVMTDYLDEEKLKILGRPLPIENEDFELDVKNLKDFEFKFDIGLVPEINVAGISGTDAYDRYDVKIDPEIVDKDLTSYREKAGQNEPIDDVVKDNDMVSLNVEELDGDVLKENGWASTFSVLISDQLSDSAKADLMGKSKGDKLRFNIYELEKDREIDFVKKYFLNVPEDEDQEIGVNFEAEINEVQRRKAAELNQEFFDKVFGEGKVSSEEEARKFIEDRIKEYYDKMADSVMFRDVKDALVEKNPMELPNDFLRKLIKVTNPGISEEQVEKEFPMFVENLQWTLLRNQLIEDYKLEVAEEEIFDGMKDRVRRYFGGFSDELMIHNMANRMMEDNNQVDQLYQELIVDKMFQSIKGDIKMNDKTIDSADFDEIVKELREQVSPNPVQEKTDVPENADEVEEEIIEEGEIS